MDEMTDDSDIQLGTAPIADTDDKDVPEREQALVKRIAKEIKDDKAHHDKAFKRMRDSMYVATHGAPKDWPESSYVANIVGRHIRRRTDALYAKNPKVKASRRDTMDFAVWDETPAALQMAQQISQMVQQANAAAMQTPPTVDPLTGMVQPVVPPEIPGAQQALAVMQDVQQGLAKRDMVKRYSKTLEILYSFFMREQKPLEFKELMKQLVRRTCTTSVGYIEIGFQREYGPRPGMTEKLTDFRARLDHMKRLTHEIGEGEIDENDAEMAELEGMIQSLQAEPEVLLREGLIFDAPASTRVIPDRYCKSLIGFMGARHVTIEYSYTVDEVEELFGVDVSGSYTGYGVHAGSMRPINFSDQTNDTYTDKPDDKKGGLVCVWKHYDRPSGLVYYLADGHAGWLRPPAAPDIFVEDFWPIYALTFNAVENEDELFPPSDVELLLPMQMEYNRSRQGMREHRVAARPRWAYAIGSFGNEEDPMHLVDLKPFEAIGLQMSPEQKLADILQVVPVPGVDPNLYETNQLFTDMQIVGGAQEAQYGATTGATATQSAIAANSTGSSDSAGIDDLDAFLTRLARAGGQVLQREMSPEKVTEIVGVGALWPPMTLNDIVNEVYLEVEAGSSGKPNQAIEVSNFQTIAPILLQIPGISPDWLAKEAIRRMDDRLDLTDAIIAGIPSIAAQNAMTQATAVPPDQDPNNQGAEGASNTEKPNPGPGSQAPMGDNRDTPPQLQYG